VATCRPCGTSRTGSAWDQATQSGGAVLALLGHVLEKVPTLVPMSLTRLTVDIVRPVPVGEHLRWSPRSWARSRRSNSWTS